MYRIIVKHSHIEIHNYKLGDSPRIENNFIIYDHFTHCEYYKGIEYIEDKNILILPRGVDIHYLENCLGVNAILDTNHDEFDYLDDVKIKYLPRDDKQKEALKFVLGKEHWKNNKYKSQLSINLNTGVGKSYVSIMSICYLSMRSIIITSSLDWLNQWKNYIMEYTTIKAKEIYFISGSHSIKSLLKKDMSKYKVILASHNTIKSYGDTYGWDKVTELFKFMKVGIKIYDEAHLNFANMCKIDFYTNTKLGLFVTATPKRSNEQEDRIFQLYFKNVPSIDLFDEDEDPHTHYISFKYMSHPSPKQISDCKNQYGLDRASYANYVVQQENYYNMLIIILDKAMTQEGKTLIYIGTNNAIEITRDWIVSTFPELKDEVGIYTSLIKENKKGQLDKKIILSTTKSCGAAMDIKGLKMTVVLAEPFKSEVLARQTLGRTRADDTYYIEVVDISFSTINKYYYQKKNTFSKYAMSCNEVMLRDDELEYRANSVLIARRERIKAMMYRNPILFVDNSQLRNPITFVDNSQLRNPISFVKLSGWN